MTNTKMTRPPEIRVIWAKRIPPVDGYHYIETELSSDERVKSQADFKNAIALVEASALETVKAELAEARAELDRYRHINDEEQAHSRRVMAALELATDTMEGLRSGRDLGSAPLTSALEEIERIVLKGEK